MYQQENGLRTIRAPKQNKPLTRPDQIGTPSPQRRGLEIIRKNRSNLGPLPWGEGGERSELGEGALGPSFWAAVLGQFTVGGVMLRVSCPYRSRILEGWS